MTTQAQTRYTEDQVARMTEAYTAEATQATVEALATELGRSTKSVVAKLAQLGLYQSKAKAKKAGTAKVTKAERAEALAYRLGVAEADRAEVAKALATLTGKVLEALETAR
jgi:hypothetical protein